MDDKALEPFILPAELTGVPSTGAPALPPPTFSSPPFIPRPPFIPLAFVPPVTAPITPARTTPQVATQLDPLPINIKFTAASTATTGPVSTATSAVSTTVIVNTPVVPQTPGQKAPIENPITPGLIQRLMKFKQANLTAAQIKHYPAEAQVALFALHSLNTGDTPLDADVIHAALSLKNSTSQPPPYEPKSEDDMDSGSSELSDAKESIAGNLTDQEDMEVDGGKGSGASGWGDGRSRGRGRGRGGGRGGVGQAASGSARVTRSKPDPTAEAGKVERPKRAAKQPAAQRTSVSSLIYHGLFY